MSDIPGIDDGKAQEVAAQKDALLRQILTSDARSRLSNVRMVRPDLAANVENYLISVANQGRLSLPITDDQLKQVLLSLQQPRRSFKMNRI